MRNWYQKRIKEESVKNQKLNDLHQSLVQLRDLREKQAQMNNGQKTDDPKEEEKASLLS